MCIRDSFCSLGCLCNSAPSLALWYQADSWDLWTLQYSAGRILILFDSPDRSHHDSGSGSQRKKTLACWWWKMSYTQIALSAVFLALLLDFFVLKTTLLKRKVFWTSYAIILPFQLLTNWWLTSRNIVMYNAGSIIGTRIASAPVEDLLFGFALILGVQSTWVYLGRRGV